MSYLKRLRKRRKKKDSESGHNRKDDQGQIQNEEKEHEMDLVKETPSTNDIAEIAMFIADRYYNGQYTIEKYGTDCYQFCFGVGDSSRVHAEGKTVSEAMGRAIVLEIPSGREDTKSYEKSMKLASDRLVMIRDERQKSKELRDDLAERDVKYAKTIKEKDNKLIAKDKEYDELTMKYRDSEAFVSEQAGAIEDNKQGIKELQDNIALKESENVASTKENEKNKAYTKVQENIIGKLQNKVRAREDENVVLTKEKEELEQEKAEIMQVISKFRDRWKSDDVMRPFEEKIATKKEKLPDIVDVILESTENLRHQLRAPPSVEGMKKIIARANELFSEGYDNLAIRDELTVYFPEITEEDVQKLREKWEQKIKPEVKPLVEPEVTEERAEEKAVKPEEPVERGEELLLELGPRIDVISKHSIFKNPFEKFETLFCDDNPYHYSEIINLLKKYDRYNRYKEKTLEEVRGHYIKHASKFYWVSEKAGHRIFKTEGKKAKIERDEYLERREIKEEAPKIEEEKKKYEPLGKVFKNYITDQIKGKMFDGELKRIDFNFHNNPIRDASQMLNEGTPFLSNVQIQRCVRDVFKNFEELEDAPTVVVNAYILYFEIKGLIEKTEKEGDITYTVKKDLTIPKLKKKKKPEPKEGVKLKKDENGPSAEDILGMEG